MHLVFFCMYTYCCNTTVIVTVTVAFTSTSFSQSCFLFVPFCRLVKIKTRHTVFLCPLVLSSRFIPSSFSFEFELPPWPCIFSSGDKAGKQKEKARVYSILAYANANQKYKEQGEDEKQNPVAGTRGEQTRTIKKDKNNVQNSRSMNGNESTSRLRKP